MESSYVLSQTNLLPNAELARIIYETLAIAPDTSNKQNRSTVLDALINQLVTLKPLGGLSQKAVSPAVLEAVVLSSTSLSKPSDQSSPSFRIILASPDQQRYEIASKSPLPEGTRIQLKPTGDNSAVLLKILEQPTNNKTPASSLSATNSPEPTTKPNLSNNTAQATNKIILSDGVRRNLPLQQPLKNLLPVLQQLASLPEQALPSSTREQIQTLLQHFPKPEQLQQPQAVKQFVRNSGVFLESKLAFAAQSKNTEALLKSPALQKDIKTQLQQLSQQITQQSATNKPSDLIPRASHTTNTTRQTPIHTQPHALSHSTESTTATIKATGEPLNAELSQAEKGLPGVTPGPHQSNQQSIQTNATAIQDNNLDILLQQLGRQLLASLARTQINQLESLSQRAANSPDGQAPTNSWVLEIPIQQGQRVDNLELRIDQEEREGSADSSKQKQWTIMLAFDLHKLGKMSVQLKIVSQSVEATVWSQLQQTHQQVQAQIDSLQNGLEKIGIKVERVACYHGMPAKNAPNIHQQLVDLHT